MKPLVYIAGPYSHPDPVVNTKKALDVADLMLDEGRVTPIVPHLTMFWHFHSPRHIENWYAYDLEVLARCDALYRLQGESTGADREEAFAVEADIPIFRTFAVLYIWASSQ